MDFNLIEILLLTDKESLILNNSILAEPIMRINKLIVTLWQPNSLFKKFNYDCI